MNEEIPQNISEKTESKKTSESMLAERLQLLLNKKLSKFDIGENDIIKLTFEDGTTLSFDSYDHYNDRPGYDNVEVLKPEA